MTSFGRLLTDADACNDGFSLDVPESWHQGRTAYGGFSSALALAAAMRTGGAALPPLRSAQMAMLAPVNGRVEAHARIERAGRNATWISAQILGEKGLAFTASFVFMGAVESGLHINDRPSPPQLIPACEGRPVTFTKHTPAFLASHFEARHAMPLNEPRQPEVCRWVRLVDGEGLDPMVALLLLGDALPPGVMPKLEAAVPVSTMHWQVNLLTSMPETEDGWWLLRSVGDYAERGCASQRMDIWNASGEPIIAALQSVALFG